MRRIISIKLIEGYKIHLYFEDGNNAEVNLDFLQKVFAREL